MLQFLSNAFNDPSDPWYYVIGVLFLLLIFGAVAVYVIWNGKRNKQKQDTDLSDNDKTDTAKTDAVENLTDKSGTDEMQTPSDNEKR